MSFLGMNEIGKLQRITNKKHWRVVTHQIPIPFLSIEFERKPADISFCISCTPLTSDRRKPQVCRHLFSYLVKYPCLGILRDIVGDRQSSVCGRAFRMNDSLRNAL